MCCGSVMEVAGGGCYGSGKLEATQLHTPRLPAGMPAASVCLRCTICISMHNGCSGILIPGACFQSLIYSSPTFRDVVWAISGDSEAREANRIQVLQTEIPARPLPDNSGDDVSFTMALRGRTGLYGRGMKFLSTGGSPPWSVYPSPRLKDVVSTRCV